MRRAYPPFDWVLPGGNAEAGESPVETALREVRQEAGLHVQLDRMTGVYYQQDHRAGEFIHFVFASAIADDNRIQPDPNEVAEYGFFSPDRLPEPMNAAHRRQLLDAIAGETGRLPVTLSPGAEG
jgi:8-oxo-dGTP diphosphatase